MMISDQNRIIRDKRWFWRGIKHEIPVCCINFFTFAYTDMYDDGLKDGWLIKELKQGTVRCPECVIMVMRFE